MSLLGFLNSAGTLVFVFAIAIAISGTVLDARRKMNWVSFIFIDNITGIAGGTLHNALLDVPVFWLGE